MGNRRDSAIWLNPPPLRLDGPTIFWKNTPAKRKKNTPGRGSREDFSAWDRCVRPPVLLTWGSSVCVIPCVCNLYWRKKLAALEAAEGGTIPEKAQTRLHTSDASQVSPTLFCGILLLLTPLLWDQSSRDSSLPGQKPRLQN